MILTPYIVFPWRMLLPKSYIDLVFLNQISVRTRIPPCVQVVLRTNISHLEYVVKSITRDLAAHLEGSCRRFKMRIGKYGDVEHAS